MSNALGIKSVELIDRQDEVQRAFARILMLH